MLADGRTVPVDEVVQTDVCIVGGGPAGLTVARELGAAGVEVVVLERGGRYPSSPVAPTETTFNVGIPYSVEGSRAFEIGGSVHLWDVVTPLGDGFGRFRELDDEDFTVRPWIPNSGWPLSKADLLPYYRRARDLLPMLKGLEPDLVADSPDVERETSSLQRRVFSFADGAVFPGEYRRNLENSENVLILTDSAALNVATHDNTSVVSSIEVKTEPTRRFSVRAGAYVLAAGGIESARILLTSASGQRGGVWNRNDQVGRYFMEHPHFPSGSLTTDADVLLGADDFSGIRLADGVPYQVNFALRDDLITEEKLNRSVFRLDHQIVFDREGAIRARRALDAAHAAGSAVRRGEWADALDSSRSAIAGMPHLFTHGLSRGRQRISERAHPGLKRYRMRVMSEQVPNPDSRVLLSDRLDEFGVPRAMLDWQLTTQDLRSISRSQDLFGRALRELGHERVESFVSEDRLPTGLAGGPHHMGTTRMSESPERGVVDENCLVHGSENLYVAGSSVFPTSGYANPTLTILALAARLAEHLTRSE